MEVLLRLGFHDESANAAYLDQTGGDLESTLNLLMDDRESGKEASLITDGASMLWLSLKHISEPTRLLSISYAVFCLKKKKTYKKYWYDLLLLTQYQSSREIPRSHHQQFRNILRYDSQSYNIY
eukprot:TRINITY_DN34647_c0_g1_i1.p1 TRINITY_DN34647_c0_g1~~TRINITY_DN34647_c0_g1_i1.p1  ORF type:complete len:124 (-),score=11.05 TRINITY_DN34647_c0_g1_i1:3-374(-)